MHHGAFGRITKNTILFPSLAAEWRTSWLKGPEELQQQAWLRVLQDRRPPFVQWPRAGAQQPERLVGRISEPAPSPSIRVNPTQAASEASLKRWPGSRGAYGTRRPRRHNRVEVFAGGPRQGPSSDGSSVPSEAGGRLSCTLHKGSPTIGEGSRRNGGRSRDGGQVRGRVAGRIAEVDLKTAAVPTNGPPVDPAPTMPGAGGRSEALAESSHGVDSGAGQSSFSSSADSPSRRSLQHSGRGPSPARRVFRSDGDAHRH